MPEYDFKAGTIDRLLDDAYAALRPVAERWGMKLDRLSITCTRTAVPVGFVFITPSHRDHGKTDPAAAHTFYMHCQKYGLQPEDLGARFRNQGKTYIVRGINRRARKYPILVYCEEDKRSYRFNADTVRFLLEAMRAAEEAVSNGDA